MFIPSVEAAAALVGTHWNGKGGVRCVTRVNRPAKDSMSQYIRGDVFWSRPGKSERGAPQWLPYFDEWVRGSLPANDAAREWCAKFKTLGYAMSQQ